MLMLHEQQQNMSMWSTFLRLTHILLINTQRSHLHTLCADGVTSGLAIMAILIRRARTCSRFYYAVVRDHCVLNGTLCTTGSVPNTWLLITERALRFTAYRSCNTLTTEGKAVTTVVINREVTVPSALSLHKSIKRPNFINWQFRVSNYFLPYCLQLLIHHHTVTIYKGAHA
jgi:hypothetical protein